MARRRPCGRFQASSQAYYLGLEGPEGEGGPGWQRPDSQNDSSLAFHIAHNLVARFTILPNCYTSSTLRKIVESIDKLPCASLRVPCSSQWKPWSLNQVKRGCH